MTCLFPHIFQNYYFSGLAPWSLQIKKRSLMGSHDIVKDTPLTSSWRNGLNLTSSLRIHYSLLCFENSMFHRFNTSCRSGIACKNLFYTSLSCHEIPWWYPKLYDWKHCIFNFEWHLEPRNDSYYWIESYARKWHCVINQQEQ